MNEIDQSPPWDIHADGFKPGLCGLIVGSGGWVWLMLFGLLVFPGRYCQVGHEKGMTNINMPFQKNLVPNPPQADPEPSSKNDLSEYE